ncbi:hypothetical protein N0V90_004772 [Kalmusia sp. IMI 367209]|nr:hypothetical protein N0V90_004772 [Kalmusia sp. IMI 367209]
MRPLTRRKQLPALSGPLRFDELPDDVLILILSQCRIDEIFALRLTCSTFRNVFSVFSTTIIPSVARLTFPTSKLLLRAPQDAPAGYTFAWLKGLVPQQLAALLVDRHRFIHSYQGGDRYGIPAEDVFGDALRLRVANGWCVLRCLSNIAEDVYSLDAKDILDLKSTRDMAWKLLQPSRYRFELSQLREDMILERRMQYIDSMPPSSAQNYALMLILLSGTFRVGKGKNSDNAPPWIFDWDYGTDGPRSVRCGKSWLTWFVLRRGPQLFWEQWCSLPWDAPETKNHIRNHAIEAYFADTELNAEDFMQRPPKEWKDVNEKWHKVQRDRVETLQRAISDKSGRMTHFKRVDPYSYFVVYAEHRRERRESGEPVIEETLSHVPFFVDFRAVYTDER